MQEFGLIGKFLIALGALLILAGAVVVFLSRSGGSVSPWLSWIGHLPGDITYRRDNVRLYFPLTTSIVLSLIITGMLWFFARR